MPKGPERRTERITLRIPPSLRVALERAAEQERRSLADIITNSLLDRFVPAKGRR